MPTTLTFFPVDNGDMTLIKLGDAAQTTLLIDVRLRAGAENAGSASRDVAKDLRAQLKKDEDGRPYVDALLLSHPDEDHCLGMSRHFHLGALDAYPDDKKDYKDKKIVIREMWSSPIVFRRAEKNSLILCADAKAFASEARRRVRVNVDQGFLVSAGDRIQILGEDINGKTAELGAIVRKVDSTFNTINGNVSSFFSARLLAPIDASDDEEEEACLAKNQSSVIINFTLAAEATAPETVNFLSGGDAEAFIWNRQWSRHKHEADVLEYDIMQAPHHCSWHSLSNDSWSEKGENAKVDQDARNALSQVRSGAIIVASSKPVVDDKDDPPCIRAKREYLSILKTVGGTFYCTGEYPSSAAVEPLVFTVTKEGILPPSKKESGTKAFAVISSARTPMPHG